MLRHAPIFAVLVSLIVSATGCGKNDAVTGENPDGDDFALGNLLDDIDLTEGGSPSENPVDASHAADIKNAANPQVSNNSDPLKLRLVRGDRFPLVKTIEQTLINKSAEFPGSASTKLDLHMDLAVEETKPDSVLLSVVYRRVSYLHDISGQVLSFDSATPHEVIPPALAPYAGMVGNGFSFWLGTDNRIQQIVGYEEFLNRCVQNVPPENREQITIGLRDNQVAGFIDDSVGLLPYTSEATPDATSIAVGDEWIRTRRLAGSAPVEVQTTCRLISLDEFQAEISLTGQIIPDTTAANESNVTILSGRSSGSCTVDRATGLPIESTRTRFMNLQVDAGNGQLIDQEKQVKTTVRAATAPRGPIVHNSSSKSELNVTLPGRVQPVAAEGSRHVASPIPTAPQRQLNSTATAVYPD